VLRWAKASGRRLSSRFMAIVHSVLSWMRWRLTRTKRERAQTALLLRLQEQQMDQHTDLLLLSGSLQLLQEKLLALPQQEPREALMEALPPLAAALHRQDSLRAEQQAETRELLLEVLNTLQPAVSDQIFQRIGPPPPTSSFPASVS